MRIPFWIARPGAVPVRPLPAAPRRPVRRHRRRAVPGRARCCAAAASGSGKGAAVREREERKRPVSYEVSDPVPIPADVDRPDKILAGLTARQVAIAATAAVIIWAGFEATRHVLPLPAFAVARRPGRAGRHRAGHRRAGRPAAGPAAGRRVAPGPLAAPPGHRPRGHPGAAGLGRAARPAAPPLPAPLAPLWRHIAADGVIGLGVRRRRRRGGGVDGELRAAQPGRAGRPDRRLRPVAELPHRPGPGGDPGRAGRPVRRGHRAARGAPAGCRTRRWSTPRWSTPRSWPAWPPSGTCSPARCCWSSASPPHGTAPARRRDRRGAGRPARRARPPGCWPRLTFRSACWTAGRSPPCSPPAPTPPPRSPPPGSPSPASRVTSPGRPA